MANKTVMRLAILIGVFALVGGGGYFLWAYQVERLANGVVARADAAEKAGKYGDAEQLYREHLAVMPDDIEVKLKYAEAILKNQGSSRRQADALMIFDSILGRHTGRDDVRRRAAELAAEMGAFEKARTHLEILLKTAERRRPSRVSDGPCREQEGDFAGAAEYYGSAVEHRAPERIEAVRLRAMLLRDKLGKKGEADKVIDAMVKSDPDDYRVYLARGQYRQRSDGKGGGDDFRKALQLAPEPARSVPEGRRGGGARVGARRGAAGPGRGPGEGAEVVRDVSGARQPPAEGRPRRPGDRGAGAGPEGHARGSPPPLATRHAPGQPGRGRIRAAGPADRGAEEGRHQPPVHPVSDRILSF